MFDDIYWMKKAFAIAEEGLDKGEVPVGAIVVFDNTIIGKGYNQVEALHDATAHAEMLAITSAANHLENWRLEGATLYVTKEPCLMCAGAIINSRVSKIVYSAYDKDDGAGGSKYDVMRENRKWFVEIIPGIMLKEGTELLKVFFNKVRNK
ncbi:MAG: CMP/dCMP deaminase zinc-binding protein [uncultured bacterium]|nr:MAG: CMP/dCMP deaminase zinc-binding protein [uncultured bacterium]